jgi:hypothetical protein
MARPYWNQPPGGEPYDNIAVGGLGNLPQRAHRDWVISTTTKMDPPGRRQHRQCPDQPEEICENPVTRQIWRCFLAIPPRRRERWSGSLQHAPPHHHKGGISRSRCPAVMGQIIRLRSEPHRPGPPRSPRLLASLKFPVHGWRPRLPGLAAASRTDPAAGSKVRRGRSITVFTRRGTLATTMPNVTGKRRTPGSGCEAKAGFDPERSVTSGRRAIRPGKATAYWP